MMCGESQLRCTSRRLLLNRPKAGTRGVIAETKIQHKVRNMVFEGDKGAFLAEVVGEDKSIPFFVWFELKDDLVYPYVLRPL